ncbi:MAG: DUF5106 domain-containing protein [Bacteroidales bacterium]|nr:DUF5106 domain-containing protein [Bacteroidales bacterium]
MKRTFNILIVLLLVSTCNTLFSQSYKLDIKISDLKDAEIYLGHYYAGKTYVKDTIRLDKNGKGTFTGDSLLDQGIYIVILPTKKYFDILIGDDQEFSIETSAKELTKNLKIKGSTENIAFNEFQLYMNDKTQESLKIQARLKNLDENSDSVLISKDRLNVLSTEIKDYWNVKIIEYEGTLFSVILRATKNVEIPEIEIPDHIQNKDSARWFQSYNYSSQHYFDNIDFSDARLLRTPFLNTKLETFFTKILIQNPDTLIQYIDIVAVQANKEMFEYIIQYFMNTYAQSDIVGMDKVLVHLADNYFLTDKVDWYNEEKKKKLKDHVAKLRFNLIGNVAQDLKMETISGEYTKLHEIKAKYTLVYFYEPSCGNCKKTTPKIYELYQEFNRDEFEVLAVYTQTEKEKWTKYINDNGFEDWINAWDPHNFTNFSFFYNVDRTPRIYLLDEHKKIIIKHIGYETLRDILEMKLGKKKDIISEI